MAVCVDLKDKKKRGFMPSNFERKYGRYAIKNLSIYIIIGYVIGYVIEYIFPQFYEYLTFNPYMIFHGQIWRLVTWIITPPETLGLFTIIMLLLYYQLGTALERAWGAYRYNVYIFSGMIFTIAGGLVVYGVLCAVYGAGSATGQSYFGSLVGAIVSTYYVNMSIMLAYAATYPNQQLMLYFIIPIRVKWIGLFYGAYLVFKIFDSFRIYNNVEAAVITVMIIVSLLNFLIYFIRTRSRGGHTPKQARRRQKYRQSIHNAQTERHYANGAHHKCMVCGRTDIDSPNLTFRYCSKCTGNKEYCEEHLFTHVHS